MNISDPRSLFLLLVRILDLPLCFTLFISRANTQSRLNSSRRSHFILLMILSIPPTYLHASHNGRNTGKHDKTKKTNDSKSKVFCGSNCTISFLRLFLFYYDFISPFQFIFAHIPSNESNQTKKNQQKKQKQNKSKFDYRKVMERKATRI